MKEERQEWRRTLAPCMRSWGPVILGKSLSKPQFSRLSLMGYCGHSEMERSCSHGAVSATSTQ